MMRSGGHEPDGAGAAGIAFVMRRANAGDAEAEAGTSSDEKMRKKKRKKSRCGGGGGRKRCWAERGQTGLACRAEAGPDRRRVR